MAVFDSSRYQKYSHWQFSPLSSIHQLLPLAVLVSVIFYLTIFTVTILLLENICSSSWKYGIHCIIMKECDGSTIMTYSIAFSRHVSSTLASYLYIFHHLAEWGNTGSSVTHQGIAVGCKNGLPLLAYRQLVLRQFVKKISMLLTTFPCNNESFTGTRSLLGFTA